MPFFWLIMRTTTINKTMTKLSVIIPVYNRPEEIVELLDSLTMQPLKNEIEVIVVDDGSSQPCESEIEHFKKQLNLKYIYQQNAGPGIARNNGAKIAEGEYVIFFDSDCVLPSDYLTKTFEHLAHEPLDCFGGPDKAHKFFTPIQKAISYSMTSILTTGGIRGGKKKMDKFYPRSFNLGVRRDVFEELGGFSDMRYGEDIDFSMKVHENGYKLGLIDETFVYHKRRNTFKSFFKQVFSSGTARIELAIRHKGAIKLVHVLPSMFVTGVPMSIILGIFIHPIFFWALPAYMCLLACHSLYETGSLRVALLSAVAGIIQVGGYGLGFLTALWIKMFNKDKKYVAFRKTFYK